MLFTPLIHFRFGQQRARVCKTKDYPNKRTSKQTNSNQASGKALNRHQELLNSRMFAQVLSERRHWINTTQNSPRIKFAQSFRPISLCVCAQFSLFDRSRMERTTWSSRDAPSQSRAHKDISSACQWSMPTADGTQRRRAWPNRNCLLRQGANGHGPVMSKSNTRITVRNGNYCWAPKLKKKKKKSWRRRMNKFDSSKITAKRDFQTNKKESKHQKCKLDWHGSWSPIGHSLA